MRTATATANRFFEQGDTENRNCENRYSIFTFLQ